MADIFIDNSYYKLAIEAYDYIIKKGKENKLYIDAYIKKLYAYNMMIDIGQDLIELEELDKLYIDVINKLGANKNTVLLLSNYAHFKGFYMHNLEAATDILEEVMSISNLERYDLASCKLEYADIMLLRGEIWTSILYYSQVEKGFRENPIGHEAKLRRAKIAYYQGDFEWAQAQLDIIKADADRLSFMMNPCC